MSVPRALEALEADTAIIKEEASGQYGDNGITHNKSALRILEQNL